MAVEFGTKAGTLQQLYGRLRSAKVLPLVITSRDELSISQESILARIAELKCEKLIVRSSSRSEDTASTSNAGAFLSLANIPAEDTKALLEAIEQVGASMPHSSDEILIQPMLDSICLCGVGFSVDKESSAPYFCISYDTSGDNASVTSGNTNAISQFVQYRGAPCSEPLMARVVALLSELESIFSCRSLDVEFAFVKDSSACDQELYCLQVRPLVMQHKRDLYEMITPRALERLSKRIKALSAPHPNVLGQKAIFGVMPDWNPAEIIGLKPKRLALSLYKEIVTDGVWAYQRDNYGYRNLRSHPLMHSFLGIPYIDVRVSFNSFIPKHLDKDIATKLVDYYLQALESTPESHDKIEFDIVFSCYDFSTPKRLAKLLEHGFNDNELKRVEFALLNLTNSVLAPDSGLYLKDLEKSQKLESRYSAIVDSNLSLYDKIYWLLEECKRFGTLPFAGVARAAFIAMQILRSLVEIGFLTQKEMQGFLASLNTQAKQLSKDMAHLQEGGLEEFLARYGHLRAGSYDITSPRYDEGFAYYFGSKMGDTPQKNVSKPNTKDKHFLSDDRLCALDSLLKEHGLEICASDLLIFLQQAIEGRESVKFAFSKLLSKALSYIKELGESLQISVEDMAHLDIKSILSLYASLYKESPKERFLQEIAVNKQEYDLTCALKLPPLITKPEEVFAFFSSKVIPNFITQKLAIGKVVALDLLCSKQNLQGAIVLIESADPGYDYLFTKHIAGFITCYGGSNSHMAIRASELQIPAVIGVGEYAYQVYANASTIQIDCQAQQIVCL